jgi:hypothetical protein
MHVHLPKPLHGWRAFFGEVGIIVVGVLIALAAEQVVQAARERERAAHAEDAIRDELGFNLGRLQSRMNIHTCVERRLAEIQALLHSAAVNPQIERPGWIGRPQYWTYASSRWQAESQAGSASLVERSRLSSYAIMYARMADMLDEMTFEQTDWAKLRTLEDVSRLEPSAAFELNLAVHDARYRNWRIELVTSQLFDMANALGLRPIRNTTPASASVCLPITTTRSEANRVSVWKFGEP